jgi:hypothetical protein
MAKKTGALIALVTVVALVDGVRTIYEPGDEVKGLHPKDVETLILAGSIEDQSATEKAEKAAERSQAAADAEFAAARAAVQQQQETIAPAADAAKA